MKALISIFLIFFSITTFAQRITDLPPATGQGIGGILPIVQGGATKKILVDSIIANAKRYADSLQIIAINASSVNTTNINTNTSNIILKTNISDTSNMLLAYRNAINTNAATIAVKQPLLVNVTKAQRDAIASPVQNQQVFVTDDGGYYSYYNNGWVENIPLVVNTKAANYTLVIGDNYIDVTVAGITLTLFSPVGNRKEVLFTNSTSASIFIASASGIGNFTTTTNYTLATDKFLRLKSNGTSWKIINAN